MVPGTASWVPNPNYIEQITRTFVFKDLVETFLYQRRCRKDSKASSWYSFSLDEPRIAPVRAKQALR